MQFMTHPDHGAHHAPDSDVESMQKLGWSISTPEQWLAGKFGEKKEVEPVIERKKPGRKPKVIEE
jgi:hypothetical protein